ncbi:MAG: sugar ABC transporter ATP-binding protein [Chloroflexi bacterium]|nr:sugar ABC transporter ATP-binding protein [Chloroflexota bacterium]
MVGQTNLGSTMGALPSDPPTAPDRALIEARDVCRTFGTLKALTDVTITFRPGEVHRLVGPNGAGKSTFLNILGGVSAPTSGRILVEDAEVHVRSPRDAAALRFSFIPQELSLVPDFSAIDNITLGLRSIARAGFVDRHNRDRIARRVADRLGMTFDLGIPVRALSPAERGLVAIGHALAHDMRFIAMDEPTASLSDFECRRLFQVIRELARDGVTVAYVSHRLDEIEDLCDRVSVFRDGRIVARLDRGGYTRKDLLRAITGNEGASGPSEASAPSLGRASSVLFSASHLSDGNRVRDVSFACREGEIIGLAGLVGSGRTEVLKLVFGESRLTAGEMVIDGRPHRPRGVQQAVRNGVALVPEERRSQGLLMDESIASNIALGNWPALRPWPPFPFVTDARPRSLGSSMIEVLGIKARNADEHVRRLSGGNQQKVVFARWLSRDSRLLLLDEPTRGVDVGARQQIWATVEGLAAQGKGVVVVSSELAELVICHRVFVVVEGRTVAELGGPGVTEDQVLSVAYHGVQQQGAE